MTILVSASPYRPSALKTNPGKATQPSIPAYLDFPKRALPVPSSKKTMSTPSSERIGNCLTIPVGNGQRTRINLGHTEHYITTAPVERSLSRSDYKAPQALETENGQEQITNELTEAIEPVLEKLIANRQKNQLWKNDFNTVFNQIINAQLFPKAPPSRVSTEIELASQNPPKVAFRPDFQAGIVSDSLSYQRLQDQEKRFIADTRLSHKIQPSFLMGHLGLFPTADPDSRRGQRELKTLLHDRVADLVQHLAQPEAPLKSIGAASKHNPPSAEVMPTSKASKATSLSTVDARPFFSLRRVRIGADDLIQCPDAERGSFYKSTR
jgi:hypothetical protein